MLIKLLNHFYKIKGSHVGIRDPHDFFFNYEPTKTSRRPTISSFTWIPYPSTSSCGIILISADTIRRDDIVMHLQTYQQSNDLMVHSHDIVSYVRKSKLHRDRFGRIVFKIPFPITKQKNKYYSNVCFENITNKTYISFAGKSFYVKIPDITDRLEVFSF